MPDYLYPGVYVEEVDTGNKPIEGVSTSIVGFLGSRRTRPVKADVDHLLQRLHQRLRVVREGC